MIPDHLQRGDNLDFVPQAFSTTTANLRSAAANALQGQGEG
jgi:hypothetical protein